MKKILLCLLIIIVCLGGIVLYNRHSKGEVKLLIEDEKIDINKLIIYGTHLNLYGICDNNSDFDLVLYNGEFRPFKLNITEDGFNLSDNINEGIDLESFNVGKYYAFLRKTIKGNSDEAEYKYYALNNTTKYKNTTYYTFSNLGYKITLNTDSLYNTLTFNVTKNTDKDIYDVVVDAGHGGIDGGAHKNGYDEADFTIKAAYSLKDKLEKMGVKVKLTRLKDQLSADEKLPDYGVHGRAVINHEVYAKYVFSIHLNSNQSSKLHGLEIYTAANTNRDFAKNLASNIVKNSNTSYSNNPSFRVDNGIYTRTFDSDDIEISKKEAKIKEIKPYDISVGTNYYFMIRETGGIMTGAYVDNRNEPEILGNPYYDSNIGSAAYLFELGYLTNVSDLNNIRDNMDKYTDAIASTFKTVFDSSQ